ncbi:S-layer homology domain-containing protein [Halanaerobium congolense]|uniref:S-layer homology domain-containing protein n=1 Tax=Halanaerobium congolense TaxID=54121 RepID=UPI00087EDB0A|nr:S-layer homology domain-containing protein [Halanaerobium congolense]SDH47680.1 S-layer homology domain-containing protein [Halanaerobium congolense]SHM40886.1 S-layer homology domain-containing protein [Halanaerobium congolense]
MIVLFSLAAILPAGAQSFSDVPANHWSYEAINKLVQAGIVEGYPDGEYKGQRNMSRYEMAVMVSRALDTIESEMEAMESGLTMSQAQKSAAVIRALMERNTQDELSDQQVEEVADIVDALTYELEDELKTLGVEVDNLAQDVEAIEAKIAEMNIPEDNIEFAAEVSTSAEVANYEGETNEEIAAAMRLWADSDALDLDLPVDAAGDPVVPQTGETTADYLDRIDDWKDADDLPAEKRFWQEYDFLISGNLGDASFDLELETVANVFTDEKSAFGYAEPDQNLFQMDTGLLTVDYNQPLFNRLRAGDIDDYHVNRYFVDEEDTELIEVTTGYFDLDWTFMTGGFSQGNNDQLYLIRTAKELESAEVFGEINQMRGSDRITNVELGLRDFSITDSFKAAAQVVFNRSKAKDTDDIFFNLRGDYAAADDLDIYAVVDSAGEEFTSYKGDLEEDYDFDLFKLGADYQINENNELMAAYSMVQIGDQIQTDVADYNDEDKSIFELALNNESGAFTNKLALEYTINDNYTDNYETRVIELGTEYALSERTTAAAALVNKDEDNDGTNVINYNYFKGNLGIDLAENVSWENEAKYILGDAAEVEGESSAFTTSLIVNF